MIPTEGLLAEQADQSESSPRATDLWRLSAGELACGYRSGEFDPVDVIEACLARAEACEPALNAMVVLDRSGALAAAHESSSRFARGTPLGPLDGVPVSVKDNMHVSGLATSWGSRLLRNVRPARDEVPVSRVRAAGAVIIGKTNLSEFAMQGFTSNAVAGTTRNPWNPALTPGGSSGGAVAGVAAGYCPIALATDGGGSTRRPASHCGLVGFKPSMGLAPRGGGLPEIFLGYEVAGAIGRNTADVAMMTEILAGRDLAVPPPAGLRILFVPGFGEHPVDPGIARQVRDAAQNFARLGHQVEEVGNSSFAERINRLWMSMSAIGLAWMLDEPTAWPELGYGPGERPDIALCGEAAQANYRLGVSAGGTALFEILVEVEQLKREVARLFARHDILLMPATAALPWPAEESHPPLIDERAAGPRGHAIFTGFANAAGLPAIATPSGLVDGLPTGFQLVGQQGADAVVLALSRQFEEAYGLAAFGRTRTGRNGDDELASASLLRDKRPSN
ncbi:MAG TPA: amidase [Bosea sp. (in: a-proteobacteria)]|uniref:amidase n=1 Tax=Bosea sp. (in: a-proteobacteria) TaxID=1871050 RepID=UPI002E14BD26|nr:amidase [Bosea sp. (in: a-proteobacteria)]